LHKLTTAGACVKRRPASLLQSVLCCAVLCADDPASCSASAAERSISYTQAYMRLPNRRSEHAVLQQWQPFPGLTGPASMRGTGMWVATEQAAIVGNKKADHRAAHVRGDHVAWKRWYNTESARYKPNGNHQQRPRGRWGDRKGKQKWNHVSADCCRRLRRRWPQHQIDCK
jgi:hypothetical protein